MLNKELTNTEKIDLFETLFNFSFENGILYDTNNNEFFIEKHNFDFSTLMGFIRYAEALAEIRGQINMQVAIHRLFGLNKMQTSLF